MAEINETAVGRRAVELAEKDGFGWQLDYQQMGRPGTKIEGQRFKNILDEEGQRKYRALARQQLEREAGNA